MSPLRKLSHAAGGQRGCGFEGCGGISRCWASHGYYVVHGVARVVKLLLQHWLSSLSAKQRSKLSLGISTDPKVYHPE